MNLTAKDTRHTKLSPCPLVRIAPLGCALLMTGCREERAPAAPPDEGPPAATSASATPVFGQAEIIAVPPKGMVLVPGGVLLSGTPEGRLPRIADAEMPGSQVVMKPFFIDEYPFPNEAGAIPRTGLGLTQAETQCAQQGKRLCTELEWERACKGPDNKTYPYGDTYRAADCLTGTVSPAVPPVGVLPRCKSAFGMKDTHGGVFQWTRSPWGRGTVGNLYTLRGGNAEAGEVIGRCANAIGRKPNDARGDFGFRCCQGEPNLAEVTIDIVRGAALKPTPNDEALGRSLLEHPPKGLTAALAAVGDVPFKIFFSWRWRPIGNEELLLQSGCAQPKATGSHAACGIAVSRVTGTTLTPVGFASSSWWLPNLHEDTDPRDLWVFGGDELGGYRRKLQYAWGEIIVGDAEHKALPKKKKKKR